MRCYCCNAILTPSEARKKFAVSGTYTETCNKCLDTMDTPVRELNDEYTDEDFISMDELLSKEDDLFESYDSDNP